MDVWLELEPSLGLKYLRLDGADYVVWIIRTVFRVPVSLLSHLSAEKNEDWNVNLCSFQNLFYPVINHLHLFKNFSDVLAFFETNLTQDFFHAGWLGLLLRLIDFDWVILLAAEARRSPMPRKLLFILCERLLRVWVDQLEKVFGWRSSSHYQKRITLLKHGLGRFESLTVTLQLIQFGQNRHAIADDLGVDQHIGRGSKHRFLFLLRFAIGVEILFAEFNSFLCLLRFATQHSNRSQKLFADKRIASEATGESFLLAYLRHFKKAID